MKTKLVIAFALILATQITFASDFASDRKEIAPGAWAVLFTDNYEYACKVKVVDGSETINSTVWIDNDFKKNTRPDQFRLAISFPENSRVLDYIGSEINIQSISYGRCLTTCIAFNVENMVLEFKETSKEEYSLTGTNLENNQVEVSGTCHKNEVE